MANFPEQQEAEKAYETFCEMLDEMEWSYDRDDENLTIKTGANGDDLPLDIKVTFNVKLQICTIFSSLPFKSPDEDTVVTAVAICATNYNMVDGSFDFDLANGNIAFRITTPFRNSVIDKEAYKYLLMICCTTVDKYNDKLLALTKHHISLDEYIDFTKE